MFVSARHRSSSTFRSIAPLLVLGPILALAPRAHAVQSSASISLYPANWGFLPVGELVDVVVVVNNTSTDTPANVAPNDGVGPVPAQLTGNITVKLACADPTCTTQIGGALAFVPVGGSGCVDKVGAVTACSAAGPNDVVIRLNANGVTLPAGGEVEIATIRIQVVANPGVAQLGLMAFTDPAAIRACSSSAGSVCATCDASGCTQLVFDRSVLPCPHACPERIIFRDNGPDFFEFHSLILPKALIDPPNQVFNLFLSNNLFPSLFGVPQTIPAGGFVPQGDGTWTFRNQDARDTGGVAFVKISRRDGAANAYKIDIQAFDPALEARATVPTMTVRFTLGPEVFETTNDWTMKPNGWLLNLP